MTRRELIKVCDVCHKKVSDDGQLYATSHPHSGWFTVTRSGGSSNMPAINLRNQWDCCSVECLAKLAVSRELTGI